MSSQFFETPEGKFGMKHGLQRARQASPEQRAAIRRVVAQDTLDSIQSSARLVRTAAQPGGAVLNDAVTINDLKAQWLREPVVRLVQATGILSSDQLDNKGIGGGRVAKRLARVATRAEEVAELYTFLAHFSCELLTETWLPLSSGYLLPLPGRLSLKRPS